MMGDDRSAVPSRPWAVERLAWGVGILCLAVYAAIRIAGAAGAHRELGRFERSKHVSAAPAAASGSATSAAAPRSLALASPDTTLWSPERIRGWQESLSQPSDEPLGVLRIPKINLEVAVLDGTDDWTLNRAVGRIAGTALPGSVGNVGIAGHRDGFFRGLKDIGRGDQVLLETRSGREVYLVEDIRIVKPDDVSVLDDTAGATLTLVTCYPFYFVGSAPDRYIVRAAPAATAANHLR